MTAVGNGKFKERERKRGEGVRFVWLDFLFVAMYMLWVQQEMHANLCYKLP